VSTSSEIEALEARLLLQGIYERYGYDFRGYAQDSMLRRLRNTLAKRGLKHLGELQHRALTEKGFFQVLLRDLTVQVSSMFRDPSLHSVLRSRLMPVLRTYPQIKIWHAGCASGEEVYTVAITFLEEGLLDRTQIYATDIDATAIEQAREGVYAESLLADFEQSYYLSGGKARPEDYYTRAYSGIAFREQLRKHIVFFQHDLVSDYAIGEMQLIFCRNVLIYFGPELRSRVIEMLAHGLCRGGFLCLGSSEQLSRSEKHFEEFDALQRIYRRVAA